VEEEEHKMDQSSVTTLVTTPLEEEEEKTNQKSVTSLVEQNQKSVTSLVEEEEEKKEDKTPATLASSQVKLKFTSSQETHNTLHLVVLLTVAHLVKSKFTSLQETHNILHLVVLLSGGISCLSFLI
jgi:2-oxoglutarate dehydrogenase complex dehydrogenase (E1) component-like enzyme